MAGRHRTGHLYRRGKVWWLKYQLNERPIYQSLGTKSKTVAMARRDQIMRPLRLAEQADAMAVLVGRLEAAKTDSVLASDDHMKKTLGLRGNSTLEQRIHEVFVPVVKSP